MYRFVPRNASFRICLALAVVVMVMVMGMASSVSAQLNPGAVGHPVQVGPVNPDNMFPAWYKDENGKRMELCLNGSDPLCGYLPGDIPNADIPISFPDNFPQEAFYMLASNLMNTTGGVRAVTHLALEAAFLQGPPVAGDQMVFGRVRFFYGGLPGPGVYKITHPFGQDLITAVDDGLGVGTYEIRYTDDVGDLSGLKNGGVRGYQVALNSRVGPFLQWDTQKPAGYLGNPDIEHTVTGSVHVDEYGQPQNYVRIEGPFNSANGPFTANELVKNAQGNVYSMNDPAYVCTNGVAQSCLEYTLFGLRGKEAVNGGVEIDEASYSRAADGTVLIDVFANSVDGQSLVVRDGTNGTYFASTAMKLEKNRYIARIKMRNKNSIPPQLRVDNVGDVPVSSFTLPVKDRVTASAVYNTDTKTLNVTASSSDQGQSATFTVGGYGTITGAAPNVYSGELNVPLGAVPKAITVTSTAGGGSITIPVTLAGAEYAPIPIVAEAGIDQRIIIDNEVLLDGSTSSGDIDSYSWTQTAGNPVTLLTANTASTTFKAPSEPGMLTFQLTVKGPAGTHSDTVNINVVPSVNLVQANAGADQSAVGGNTVTLDGSASTGDVTSYSWAQTGGPAVTLANANTAVPTFTAPPLPVATPFTFELTVQGPGGPQIDTVVVNVTPPPPPVAKALLHQVAVANTEGTIDGSTSTGFIDTYSWTQTGGPSVTLANPNSAVTTFVAPPVSAPTTLTFVLSVRGPGGLTTDTLLVQVTPPPPPVANAGPAQTVAPQAPVTLDGSGSTGDISTYSWLQIAGPQVVITNGKKVNPTFTAPQVTTATTLTFELTVEGLGGTNTSTVTVNVIPVPVAKAGADQTVLVGTPVTLDGSGSTGDITSYSWTQTGGSPVTLSNATTSAASFTAPDAAGTLTLQLTVTGPGGTSTSLVTVNVTPAVPAANAGATQTVAAGTPVTLDGSGSTGVITSYAWKHTSGTPVTLTGDTTASPTFTAPDLTGDLTFELTVNGPGGTSTSTVTITVTPAKPAANAGAAQTVAVGTPVTLDGSASTGVINSYAWTQTAGTPVTLTGDTTASPAFTAPETEGTLTFELTVIGPGGTSKSTVTITVTPTAPVANAGAAQTAASSASVTLDGSGSTGTITTYSWKQTAGPDVTLTGADKVNASFTAPVVSTPATLTFELTVAGPGGTNTSTVSVDITPPNAPVANAGADQTVAVGSPVTLNATGSTGAISSYAWTQPAGVPVTLTGDTTASPTFTAPDTEGTLTFELTVNGPGGTSTSTVTITVTPAKPVANAGAAQTVAVGTPVTLDGSTSTGVINSYAWTQTAGTQVTLTGDTTASPTFTAPETEATLTFELTVTGPGGTNTSTVTVTVTPAAPVANAGAAQTAASDSPVTLDGSGSTGTITTYSWTQTAGPAVTLTGADTVNASFKAPVVSTPTTLTFELTVAGPGGTTTSKVDVSVTPPNAPTANAGAGQTAISDTPVTLDGSGSTGTITTYAWKQTAGPDVTLTGADKVNASFTAPVVSTPATLTFELTVVGPGGTSAGTVNIEVAPPNAPVASAGPEQTIITGSSVTLNGTGSTGHIDSYLWTQTAGTPVTLTGEATASPSFTAPEAADTLTFTLTVKGPGGTTTSSVIVNVVPPAPSANAGPDQKVVVGSPVTLDGSGSTGLINSYAWVQTAGTPVTLTGETTANPTFTAPDTPELLTFELTVKGPGGTTTSSVSIDVTPTAPAANAGAEQTAAADAPVTLDGSGSTGVIASYSWQQTAGPNVTLTGADTVNANFTAPVVAASTTLTFELTVAGPGGTSVSTVNVVIAPPGAPVANAGAAQTATGRSQVTLDGSGSTGHIDSYVWTQTAGTPVTLSGGNTSTATFTAPDVADTLSFSLTVMGPGGTTTSQVTVTVTPGAPVANAGSDQTAASRIPFTLDGSGSTGVITSYSWTQTAGPVVTLTGANTAHASFGTPDGPGLLTFQLTVEGPGGTSTSVVHISLLPPPPIADAGTDHTAAYGTNVTLNGTASTGHITSYLWKQIAGPLVTLTNATASQASFRVPAVSVPTPLQFELTVEGPGGISKSTVTVTAAPPVAPVAKAVVTPNPNVLEGNPVTLDGSGSTGDELVYKWHEASSAVADMTGVMPRFVVPLTASAEGMVLHFTLTVTGPGGTSTTTVDVNVKNVANAGADQTVAQGTTVTLNGTGSLEATSYTWTQISGPTVALNGANTASPTFVMPKGQPATRVFQLTARGPLGPDTDTVQVSTIPDTVAISVANYDSSKRDWRLEGTSTVVGPNVAISIYIGGVYLMDIPVDTLGAWRYRGAGNALSGNVIRADSTSGGTRTGNVTRR